MRTFPSYEQDAKICPYFGCAQATCQTGPAWLGSGPSKMGIFHSENKRHTLWVCVPSVVYRHLLHQILSRCGLKSMLQGVFHSSPVEHRAIIVSCGQFRHVDYARELRLTIMSSCAVSMGTESDAFADAWAVSAFLSRCDLPSFTSRLWQSELEGSMKSGAAEFEIHTGPLIILLGTQLHWRSDLSGQNFANLGGICPDAWSGFRNFGWFVRTWEAPSAMAEPLLTGNEMNEKLLLGITRLI